jgi:hypothetical protein
MHTIQDRFEIIKSVSAQLADALVAITRTKPAYGVAINCLKSALATLEALKQQ